MIEMLKLGSLLESDRYVIPVYQREFAWSAEELMRLVRDIEGARKSGRNEYYIGTLVTFHDGDVYEVVDGQQRLTALSLLFSLSGDGRGIRLSYESRPSSVESLEELRKGKSGKGHIFFSSALILAEALKGCEKDEFFCYLENHVFILRTCLRPSVDLNRYFKIMNSRTDQCTRGDVVFSYLFSKLDDSREREIAKVSWKGLSDMSHFLAGGIPERLYNRMIYGDGIAPLTESESDAWWSMIKSHTEGDGDSILASLDDALVFDSEEFIRPHVRSEKGQRFSPVVTFDEFLLIAAGLYTGEKPVTDDRALTDVYQALTAEWTDSDVRSFIHFILKLRCLFDTYIIRREGDEWCLLKYRDINEYTPAFGKTGRELIILQSLFASSMDSVCWLVPVLSFLLSHTQASGEELLEYLKTLKGEGRRYGLYLEEYFSKGLPSPPYLVEGNGKLRKV